MLAWVLEHAWADDRLPEWVSNQCKWGKLNIWASSTSTFSWETEDQGSADINFVTGNWTSELAELQFSHEKMKKRVVLTSTFPCESEHLSWLTLNFLMRKLENNKYNKCAINVLYGRFEHHIDLMWSCWTLFSFLVAFTMFWATLRTCGQTDTQTDNQKLQGSASWQARACVNKNAGAELLGRQIWLGGMLAAMFLRDLVCFILLLFSQWCWLLLHWVRCFLSFFF